MALIRFWISHRLELAALVGQHVFLVAISTIVAVAVGVPLGIFASRRPRLAAPIVAIANVMQTIPSLAMFGFLLPVPFIGGVGARAAVVVLILYGLLPILRTTITGLNGIDPAIRLAGRAMGMTPRELLRQVELPLALPSILAGVRVAAVVGVGSATIAAAIGAGGLGEYIYRGLSMVDTTVILAGAIPAAAVALVVDGALLWTERQLSARRRSSPRRVVSVAALIAAFVLLSSGVAARRASGAIVVGSKNFTEQVILGELLAQTIEREAGLSVDRRLNLGGTLICDRALLAGDLDVYVEYTGTALTAIFHQPVPSGTTADGQREEPGPANEPSSGAARASGSGAPRALDSAGGPREGSESSSAAARASGGGAPRALDRVVYDSVRDLYARSHRTLLPPLGFNNTFAILVRGRDARERQLRTIDDVAREAPRWQAGFGYEFLERPDGYSGLAKTYGLRFAAPPRVMDLTLTYRALASGQVDVIAGDATAGLIKGLDLVQLDDNRHYFPPYDAAPVARAEVLLRYPRLRAALEQLGGRVSANDMRAMNFAADVEHRDVRAIVTEFLARK